MRGLSVGLWWVSENVEGGGVHGLSATHEEPPMEASCCAWTMHEASDDDPVEVRKQQSQEFPPKLNPPNDRPPSRHIPPNDPPPSLHPTAMWLLLLLLLVGKRRPSADEEPIPLAEEDCEPQLNMPRNSLPNPSLQFSGDDGWWFLPFPPPQSRLPSAFTRQESWFVLKLAFGPSSTQSGEGRFTPNLGSDPLFCAATIFPPTTSMAPTNTKSDLSPTPTQPLPQACSSPKSKKGRRRSRDAEPTLATRVLLLPPRWQH